MAVAVATARANAGEAYGHGLADATRDWQQFDAWKTRNQVWGFADTTTAPNYIDWSTTVSGLQTTYFNATAQAARDEVTWWGNASLTQTDREALAEKTSEQNSAEAVRIRENAIATYEEAFDLLWINTLNTEVQTAMYGSAGAGLPTVPYSPWHQFVGAVTLAEHDLVTGTRPSELSLAMTRNNAEKEYQSAVSDARETLRHDRAVAEIAQAGNDAEANINETQATFAAHETIQPPEPLKYSAGFAEAFPFRPRRLVPSTDPTITTMLYGSHHWGKTMDNR